MLLRLVDHLLRRRVAHPLRVAVDGPDAAGKTRFSDDLAHLLSQQREVIRLSVDSFHRPEAVRRQRGSLSAEGYYLDSFDHDIIVGSVLRPLGPGGDGRYRPAAYDYRADEPVPPAYRRAAADAIVVFDGVFLLRPELHEYWDVALYLHVAPEVTVRRALERDLELFGSAAAVEQRYRGRYLPGQELYRVQARPLDRADIVLDMTDPLNPGTLRWKPAPASAGRHASLGPDR
ncbi:uridylate kinase [Micromonospora sp. C28SCA-DRY-2]|uniref:uridylate kinase n=1 Tax=Micromonospora sp. C28SCA-DRY-2 TaxID=3059522 RepID=UPI00267441EC|nr:uridylate kinase [Micromonospora sp. C28SCA-DRY-2]MDO3701785.1 uridylate kinase [Micromonospora sp. C28SCA-DRY-2]